MTKPPNPAASMTATLTRRGVLGGVAAAMLWPPAPVRAAGLYTWLDQDETAQSGLDTLSVRFPPPPAFDRLEMAPGSFAAWLRGLPMQNANARVHLYSGIEKPRQDVHAGVIAIDTGTADLQQCADAIMRLRAEWLYASARANDIAFDVSEGGRVPFSRWAKGERPAPSGKTWKAKAAPDTSYKSLRKYLDFIFAYAGTLSLEKELQPVADPAAIEPGDVFIKGGAPGHAVLVADVVAHPTTRARRFLLIQSFMPAQEMHVLRNPGNPDGSPWYNVPHAELVTPEWTFPAGALHRWPQAGGPSPAAPAGK